MTQLSVSGVQEMQTRCQLHFGGMIGDGGRRADRGITECRRRERPSQLFCLLSYAARPSGIMGNAARENLSTCICRRGLITRLLFPLFEGFFKMSEVCRRWFCVKSLVLSRHADCFKFGKLISFQNGTEHFSKTNWSLWRLQDLCWNMN